MQSKFKITLVVEVDRDMVPGFGHEPEHWRDYMLRDIMRQKHYNPRLLAYSAQTMNVQSHIEELNKCITEPL